MSPELITTKAKCAFEKDPDKLCPVAQKDDMPPNGLCTNCIDSQNSTVPDLWRVIGDPSYPIKHLPELLRRLKAESPDATFQLDEETVKRLASEIQNQNA